MAETFVQLTINIRASGLRSGGSSKFGPQGNQQEIEKKTWQAVNYAVDDIAFRAGKKQQRQISGQLESKISGIVVSELRAMGRKIARQAIGLGPGARWPSGGSLEVEGQISNTLREMDPSRVQNMSIKAVTGIWRARTQEYLRKKSKKFGHKKWWLNTGDLRREMQNPQMYLAAYGPVRVTWIPEKVERSKADQFVTRISSFARGRGQSHNISVGKIRISILGRITADMLNGPNMPSYDSRFNGLLGALPEGVEKKLASRGNPYRPIMEPFLTFYINRQIPNRIWRTLEQSIKTNF
jgi:hypothetical protein